MSWMDNVDMVYFAGNCYGQVLLLKNGKASLKDLWQQGDAHIDVGSGCCWKN